MIRPTHLIRRTAVVVANLTPDPILGLTAKAVCWLRRDAYFAGAQAAIRGDELPFNVVDLTPSLQSVRQAFEDYDAALEAEALWFAKWEQQFHPSNGGAL